MNWALSTILLVVSLSACQKNSDTDSSVAASSEDQCTATVTLR